MNMRTVVSVCKSMGICAEPTVLGVRIGTTGWRLECGGGIAGRTNEWSLRVIAGAYHSDAPDAKAEPLGPARNKAELKKLLRSKWKSISAALSGQAK